MGVKLTVHFHLVPRSRTVQLYLHSLLRFHGVVLNSLNTQKNLISRDCKDVKWRELVQNGVHSANLGILWWMMGIPLKQRMCRSPMRFLCSNKYCTVKSGLRRFYIRCRVHRDSNEAKDEFRQWSESIGKEGALAYAWNFPRETEENKDALIRIAYAYCHDSNYANLLSSQRRDNAWASLFGFGSKWLDYIKIDHRNRLWRYEVELMDLDKIQY
jgi:hypothetical protein